MHTEQLNTPFPMAIETYPHTRGMQLAYRLVTPCAAEYAAQIFCKHQNSKSPSLFDDDFYNWSVDGWNLICVYPNQNVKLTYSLEVNKDVIFLQSNTFRYLHEL